MKDNSVEMMPSICPVCGSKVGRASHSSLTEVHEPQEGDIAICISCTAVNIYADYRGTLRKITPEEYADLVTDTETVTKVQEIQQGIRQLHALNSLHVAVKLPKLFSICFLFLCFLPDQDCERHRYPCHAVPDHDYIVCRGDR